MEINEAIVNLEKTISVLDKAANDPKNYNTPFGMMLEQMSWEMYRSAQQLKEVDYMYG